MDRPERDPENLADILSRLFVAQGWGRKSERGKLEEAWAAAIGPEFASQTRVMSLKRGVVEVQVRNPVLLQELAHFMKRKLLESLRTQLPGTPIHDLKFRAGL
jgi:predicted nucleic acid-binding Zn ribbon protein